MDEEIERPCCTLHSRAVIFFISLLTAITQSSAYLANRSPLASAYAYYGLCWLLTVRCYYGFRAACETSRDKSPVFPRLPAWFTPVSYGCLLDFAVVSQLIRQRRLISGFCSSGYDFAIPSSRLYLAIQALGVAIRVRWQLRPLWTFTTDWRHARHTNKTAAEKSTAVRKTWIY